MVGEQGPDGFLSSAGATAVVPLGVCRLHYQVRKWRHDHCLVQGGSQEPYPVDAAPVQRREDEARCDRSPGCEIDLCGGAYRPVCRIGADYRATNGSKRLTSGEWLVDTPCRIGDSAEKDALRRGQE